MTLRVFLGLKGYSKRFVKNYAITVKPSMDLVKSEEKFDIVEEWFVFEITTKRVKV